ncbi:MAG TPA: hypothetical protein VJT72_15125, partial [Pseudonocardiaceae bacterium]|nr:hypothetical protein [Pseudonocardiaceae bacterium]
MELDKTPSGIELPNPDDFTRKSLTFLVLMDSTTWKDIYDLPLTYSLETGAVRWEDTAGIHTVSLRDTEELSQLWEPMTAERFTYLMTTLYPTFARETDRYSRCLLNISPEGQMLKSASGKDLEYTSLTYFPRLIGREEKEGWEYWDDLLDPEEGGQWLRGLIIEGVQRPVVERDRAEKLASQPTLADFGWDADIVHESIQEKHNPLAGPSTATVTYPRYDDGIIRAAPPNDPHAIEQTSIYLRDKLGVEPHPALWTTQNWTSANNARLNSRLHAQTADFPPEKAAHAIRALTAALKNQH